VFREPGTPEDYNGPAHIIDHYHPNGKFDEHKLMIGKSWDTAEKAKAAYLEHYPAGQEKNIQKLLKRELPLHYQLFEEIHKCK